MSAGPLPTFARRLYKKVIHPNKELHESTAIIDVDLQVAIHYGIPSTSSILAFDPIQRVLAIGTLDGRIKVIGGSNIEGLFVSPKTLPFKNLEFLRNQGFLVGISNENDIQIWDLESRHLACCLKWDSNITSFAVIHGTFLMYIGDENGLMSVLKYDNMDKKLSTLPYHIPLHSLKEVSGISCPDHQSVIGILPQPNTSGMRVLVSYESGLIILWDVSESRAVLVRGYTDLQLKYKSIADKTEENKEFPVNQSDDGQEEGEICSLCWASIDASVLAVGYINGDILLWNFSPNPTTKEQQNGVPSNNVVKIQLASGNRRLPVIVLHWSSYHNVKNDRGGQLFIYGGDEIGSEEVITVLNIGWSSGLESLQCHSRVDLKLNGSFADMVLMPNAGAIGSSTAAVFVLTNPGQLVIYDGAFLSTSKYMDKNFSPQAVKFPAVVPTSHPNVTATKLCLIPMGKKNSDDFLANCLKRTEAVPQLPLGTQWPLTGGVPSEISMTKDGIERIYIAGYQDGSVRIWDATYPILRFIVMLKEGVPSSQVDVKSGPVSALDFCSITLCLAIGDECGLVRIYKSHESTDGWNFHLITESIHEVHNGDPAKGFQCIAAFSVVKSLTTIVQFVNSGENLAVGFENGQVAMIDMSSLSLLFCIECIPTSRSAIVSIAICSYTQGMFQNDILKNPNIEQPKDPIEGVLIIVTKDAHVVVIHSRTGNMISSRPIHPKKESTALCMYVIDRSSSLPEAANGDPQHISQEGSVEGPSNEIGTSISTKSEAEESEQHYSSDALCSPEVLSHPHILLCYEDALRLYSLKSIIQGDNNSIYKVNLGKLCCWSTIFKKRTEKAYGLLLLYQTGDIEIRSVPDLGVLEESSLMSILRWSFKASMEKTMSSYDHGQIVMVNGCEIAFFSLLGCENDFRIPESWPSFHDKVVAAAAEAAINFSSYEKKKQDNPGLLGGIIKGIKGGKTVNAHGIANNNVGTISSQLLEDFFSKNPFSDPLSNIGCHDAAILTIDDIEIDEVSQNASTSSNSKKSNKEVEESSREKLLQGARKDVKPRLRTTQEILTQYRFGGDAAAAAAHSRDKLIQRQEKLERLNQRTEELQNEAENFADMANELVRTMENKKWWRI